VAAVVTSDVWHEMDGTSSCMSRDVVRRVRPADEVADSTFSLRRVSSDLRTRRIVCLNSSTNGGTLCSRCSRSLKVRRRHPL
jgi:hypothetical protein